MPDCRIGAVIIKMISSTSMTSTKGTILMSESDVPVWRVSCGMESCGRRVSPSKWARAWPRGRLGLEILLFDQRGNFHGEVIHPRAPAP